MRFFGCLVFAALVQGVSAQAAVEQCRFIQAKPDREACYARQEQDLAVRQKARDTAAAPPLRNADQLKSEDDAVARSLRSICRGC
jgi:hypothetical protein